MTEDVVKVELDTIEVAALLSIMHPALSIILNEEGLEDIIKAVKHRDVKLLDKLSDTGKRAFIASIAVAKIEMELKSKLANGVTNETTARA